MARFQDLAVLQSVACALAFVLLGSNPAMVEAYPAAWDVTTWTDSHVTFYGASDGIETMGT